jgi:chitodextrinase
VVTLLNTSATRSTGTATATTWPGLKPTTAYRFTVYARDAAGNKSGNSNTLTVTTPGNALPAVPANLHVTGTATTTVSLAWDTVPNTVSYQLMVDSTMRVPVTATTDTAAGLTPGTAYAFRVRALNSVGQSAWSAPVSGTTVADTEAPTAPVATGTAVGPSRLRISWTASTDNLGYVGYNVYLDGRPAHNMLPLDSTGRVVELQDLRAASSHQVSVRAYDRSGNLSIPSKLTLTTLAATESVAPAAPANLRADWTGPSAVHLRWDGAADNVETTAYEIYDGDALVGETLQDVFYPGFLLT